MGGALAMVLMGVVSIDDFLVSFSNKAVMTIFLLIYLTSIIHRHFPLVSLLDRLFSKARSPRAFMLQMTSSVSVFSSVMNNTPIVALFIPYVYQWGKKNNVAPSKLLIPLSYAAIFGGMITVIGTSTNLVLNGFLLSRGERELTFTDFFLPGLGVTLVGIAFLTLLSRRLLPEHSTTDVEPKGVLREYLAEAKLEPTSPIVGKTVTEAGLRNLDGVYLAEIYREDKLLPTVAPGEVLRANDRLYFAGETNRVVDVIEQFPGITWAKSEKFDISEQADLVETVVPANSFLHDKTLKQVNFRDRYDAAVIGIHRNGERVRGKLGEIVLQAGDLLLLTAGPNFKNRIERGKDLYTLQWVKESKPAPRGGRVFLLSMVIFFGLTAFGVIDFFMALLLSLTAAIVLSMFNSRELKSNTNLDLLLILGGAITVGKGFIESGAAGMITQPLLHVLQGWSAHGILIVLYLLTLVMTTFVTNVAAVAIVFPVAYELVRTTGLDPTSVYLVLAFGASAAFLTPVSYQTNIMVYGPGKYTFKNFLRIGIPFTFAYSISALLLIFALHDI
jgi:di/tricarboxylate transporter